MGRQTGKTSTIAIRAIHHAFSNPKTLTLVVSPSLRQSMIMFDRILDYTYSSELLAGSVSRKTRTVVELTNGSRIVALPCSANLLRGYTAHMVVVDEAAFLDDTIITSILFPMLATTKGSLILLSTPWGKQNYFYRAFMDPAFSTHKIPSTECPLISEEFLEEQRRSMTKAAFAMEFEAEFIEEATAYFPMELIKSCVDPDLEIRHDLEAVDSPPGDYFGGLDLGKIQDYSVLAVASAKGETIELFFMKQFPLGTPYASVIGATVRAEEKFRFRKILVDKSGVGEAVTEEILAQGLKHAEGQSFSVEKKAEILTHLKIKMEQGQLRVPYDRRLCQEISDQQYQYTKGGKLKFWHSPGAHDDRLMALALAVFGTKDRPPRGVLIKAY